MQVSRYLDPRASQRRVVNWIWSITHCMRAINLALYLEDFNRYPAIRQLPLQPARDVASILLPGRINGKGTGSRHHNFLLIYVRSLIREQWDERGN